MYVSLPLIGFCFQYLNLIQVLYNEQFTIFYLGVKIILSISVRFFILYDESCFQSFIFYIVLEC